MYRVGCAVDAPEFGSLRVSEPCLVGVRPDGCIAFFSAGGEQPGDEARCRAGSKKRMPPFGGIRFVSCDRF
jgi:hypothetical protein